MKNLKKIVSCAALAAVCAGCLYRGGKITEGVDLAVGLNIPGTEETVQLNLLNYLSGFRLGIAENSRLEVRYTSATTNSWIGCIHTESFKTIDATVEPCESEAATTNAVTAAKGDAQ